MTGGGTHIIIAIIIHLIHIILSIQYFHITTIMVMEADIILDMEAASTHILAEADCK